MTPTKMNSGIRLLKQLILEETAISQQEEAEVETESLVLLSAKVQGIDILITLLFTLK
jgi:hypothetical protein